MYDAVLMLGICDKIVPGLLMGALQFGHLPTLFVPAGPMASGLSNKEKVRVRQLYAEGKVDRAALLEAEMASYHRPGHLHLLRHCQLESDGSRSDGSAAARVVHL
jgi:phosphogluconate dehydratase